MKQYMIVRGKRIGGDSIIFDLWQRILRHSPSGWEITGNREVDLQSPWGLWYRASRIVTPF